MKDKSSCKKPDKGKNKDVKKPGEDRGFVELLPKDDKDAGKTLLAMRKYLSKYNT